jgi:hypothetical protein
MIIKTIPDLLVAALVPFLSAIGKLIDSPVSFEFSSNGVVDELSSEDFLPLAFVDSLVLDYYPPCSMFPPVQNSHKAS